MAQEGLERVLKETNQKRRDDLKSKLHTITKNRGSHVKVRTQNELVYAWRVASPDAFHLPAKSLTVEIEFRLPVGCAARVCGGRMQRVRRPRACIQTRRAQFQTSYEGGL